MLCTVLCNVLTSSYDTGLCYFPSDLPPIKKDFYTEAESVSRLTVEEVNEWR